MEIIFTPFIWMFNIIWGLIVFTGYFVGYFFLIITAILGFVLVTSIVFPTYFSIKFDFSELNKKRNIIFNLKIGGKLFEIYWSYIDSKIDWCFKLAGIWKKKHRDDRKCENSSVFFSEIPASQPCESGVPAPDTLCMQRDLDTNPQIHEGDKQQNDQTNEQLSIQSDSFRVPLSTNEKHEDDSCSQFSTKENQGAKADLSAETEEPPVKRSYKKEIYKEIRLFLAFLAVFIKRNRRNFIPVCVSFIDFIKNSLFSVRFNKSYFDFSYGFADPRITGWITAFFSLFSGLSLPVSLNGYPSFNDNTYRIKWVSMFSDCYLLDGNGELNIRFSTLSFFKNFILFIFHWRFLFLLTDTLISWGGYILKRGFLWYKRLKK